MVISETSQTVRSYSNDVHLSNALLTNRVMTSPRSRRGNQSDFVLEHSSFYVIHFSPLRIFGVHPTEYRCHRHKEKTILKYVACKNMHIMHLIEFTLLPPAVDVKPCSRTMRNQSDVI